MASGAPGGGEAAQDRWRSFLATHPAPADLVRFHTAEKMALLTRSRVLYDRLGRIVAGEEEEAMARRLSRYGELYLEALSIAPTRSGHVDALQHLAGRLKRGLSADERAELADLIAGYRLGDLPLETPVARLRQHFSAHPDSWAAAQTYLQAGDGGPVRQDDG